jgi:hypothetical protein
MKTNLEWVINCINSCTNLEQLKTCEVIIALYKFRLAKDGMTETEIYLEEGQLLASYLDKEAMLLI